MLERVTVAVDANGADLGPGEVARGAAEAARRGHDVILFGPAAEPADARGLAEIVDAPVSIAKAADPARAVRTTPEASIVQAVEAVSSGRAAALVSGGSTGATLASALFRWKRARGVHRPALALVVPVPGKPFLLLDAGANVSSRSEHLVQFAHMGAAFMEVVMGVERPRVALLSNGEEPSKGPEDVVAADGFSGNIALKVMEGTSDVLLRSVRAAAMSSLHSKLGGLLLKPALGGLRSQIDPEAHGGAVLLGLRHLGVVPHGSFGARGFASAIEVAARG